MKLYPSTTDKVLLAYVMAKCRENQTERVSVEDIIRDFFEVSNNVKTNLYSITSENDDITPALDDDMEFLRIHGLLKIDRTNPHISLTPLGQYVAMGFELPEEVEIVIKKKKNS